MRPTHSSPTPSDLVPYMTIHEELQGPLKCDQTTTQDCHESDLKKQQEVNLGKTDATLEPPSVNRCEQRCTSDEQSISEPSHLGMAKNGMNGVHMCTHTSTHISFQYFFF